MRKAIGIMKLPEIVKSRLLVTSPTCWCYCYNCHLILVGPPSPIQMQKKAATSTVIA